MKKINRLIPIVTAFLLFFPMLNVQAAPWQKNQQAPKATVSGLEGTVVMSLEQINSLEGTFKVVEKPEKGSASIQSVNAICSDMGAQGMAKNDKIFLSSSGEPMNVTLEISMKFTMEGVYTLELDGGVTDADGKYEDYSENANNYICQVEIEVGNTSGENSSTGGSVGGDFNYNSEFNLNINVETEELEEVLGEVAEAIKSDEQLKMMQELLEKMNRGLSLLEGGDQKAVDEATEDLKNSLAELETEPEEDKSAETETPVQSIEVEEVSDEEPVKKSDGFALENVFKLAKIILPILAILIFIAAAIYFWRKAKKKAPDYDGAPMVDYDIEDDDE